jgi:hypothetical protein
LPVFKRRVIEVARSLRSYLSPSAVNKYQVQRLASVENQLKKRTGELERARRQLADRDRDLAELRGKVPAGDAAPVDGLRPENFVWIFGTGRVGSTWLMRMVDELEGQTLWREPMVGLLFGYLYYLWSDEKYRATKHFILGRDRKSWLRSMRNFVLEEARSRFPEMGGDDYLVVKEPNGSIGAPLLMEALPESRMILLVRDPRDVVASALDASRQGSWVHDRLSMPGSPADEDPTTFVVSRAHKYLWYVGNSKLAYDAHNGPKALVKYEDLRADTLGTMRRLYAELGIDVDQAELARAVEEHDWENVPEDRKGEGKFHRKATPGGWREDLTEEQARTVERITAPLLKEFYSYEGESRSLSDELSNWHRRDVFSSPIP